MKTITHYDRLGISRNAPDEVIRGAYKALARTNHPDANQDNPASHQSMQEINEAYAVLSDPKKRAAYDAQLDEQAEIERASWTQPPPQRQPLDTQQMLLSEKANRIKLLIFFVAVTGAMIFSFGYAVFSVRPHLSAPPRPSVPSPAAPQTAAQAPAAPAKAAAPQNNPDAQKTLATCVFSSAKTYNVPPAVLLGILITERGAVGKETLMADKSIDLGPMQINSWWVPLLAKQWKMQPDKASDTLRDDACANVGVSAWILQSAMKRGGSSLSAIVTRYDFAAHHLVSHPVDGSASYVVNVMKVAEGFKNVRSAADLLGGKGKK